MMSQRMFTLVMFSEGTDLGGTFTVPLFVYGSPLLFSGKDRDMGLGFQWCGRDGFSCEWLCEL